MTRDGSPKRYSRGGGERSERSSNNMPRFREWDINCKVYVGNLGSSASKHEIELAFEKYGPLKNVWVARNPPGFAFVEFEDKRDAEDAVRALDGTRCCGTRIRVEMSSGRTRRDDRRGGASSSSKSRGGSGRYRMPHQKHHQHISNSYTASSLLSSLHQLFKQFLAPMRHLILFPP